MAGNVNTQPRSMSRIATRFSQLFVAPRRNKADTVNLGEYPGYVIATFKGAVGQTANILEIHDSSTPVNVLASIGPTGGFSQSATALSAFGLGSLGVAHFKYDFALDGGATGAIVLSKGATLPANAIMLGGQINSTTAVTSLGSATLAFGTLAGSSNASILAATAKASLTLDVLINAVPTFATAAKLTAAGVINATIAGAAITAGLVEGFVIYVVPANA